jgi:hypothetical protein
MYYMQTYRASSCLIQNAWQRNVMCRPFVKSFAPSAFVCASTSTQISNTQTYIYQWSHARTGRAPDVQPPAHVFVFLRVELMRFILNIYAAVRSDRCCWKFLACSLLNHKSSYIHYLIMFAISSVSSKYLSLGIAALMNKMKKVGGVNGFGKNS